MNQPPMRPRRRARRARLMRVVNVPMRRLLRLPFRTPLNRRLMLLTFTGRKTGRVYRQAVSYVPDGDTLLTPAGGSWKLNLRGGSPIRVQLGGRECSRDPSSCGTPTRWLGRFGNGLDNRSFKVQDAQVRDYGTAAVVVGMLQTPAGPPAS